MLTITMTKKTKTPCTTLPSGIAKVMKRLHYP
ncbi:IS6 family transposase, partial [Paraburkholderia steynii]